MAAARPLSHALHCCPSHAACRRLAAEGMGFFKGDWRYKCFIESGVADGLDALLPTARRQAVGGLSAMHALQGSGAQC